VTVGTTATYASLNAAQAAEATDLNGLYVGMLGWAFNKTGDSTYWYAADSLTGAMLDITYWGRPSGSGKAFNQSFWQSQKGIYWLNSPD